MVPNSSIPNSVFSFPGIAFPCCVAVNNCICHYSPLASDPDIVLKNDDMVKIDMGAHIDGFIAVVAHTVVVGASKDKKIQGRKADVLLAAHLASEAALRLIKPGNEVRTSFKCLRKSCQSFLLKISLLKHARFLMVPPVMITFPLDLSTLLVLRWAGP